jgi:putative ABC transport system substrate-binding protein
MKRREAIAALLALGARAAFAQEARAARIAILVDGTEGAIGAVLSTFRQRLRELGWTVGSNLTLDVRYSDGEQSRLPALAAELIGLGPDVIAPVTTPATRAAMRATSTIPIVFFAAGDPLGSGLVKNLSRPGGNATGQSIMSEETSAKWMELLAEVVPGARRFAFLGQASNTGIAAVFARMREAAASRAYSVRLLEATAPQEVDRAFAQMVEEKTDAFMVASAPVVLRQRKRIIEAALQHRLPGLYARTEYVVAGGLLSYSVDRVALVRRTADQVHLVLQGANPGSVPVEQPTTFVLTVNLKTARAMGLEIPQSILLRADRVIE